MTAIAATENPIVFPLTSLFTVMGLLSYLVIVKSYLSPLLIHGDSLAIYVISMDNWLTFPPKQNVQGRHTRFY